jgi:hypothetical protein
MSEAAYELELAAGGVWVTDTIPVSRPSWQHLTPVRAGMESPSRPA